MDEEKVKLFTAILENALGGILEGHKKLVVDSDASVESVRVWNDPNQVVNVTHYRHTFKLVDVDHGSA